jgi:hypothetical protein
MAEDAIGLKRELSSLNVSIPSRIPHFAAAPGPVMGFSYLSHAGVLSPIPNRDAYEITSQSVSPEVF